MKNRTFYFRLINLLIIAAVILILHAVFLFRQQEDQIAQLTAKAEEAQMNEDAYKAALAEVEATNKTEKSTDTAAGGYKDGTYRGSGKGFGGDITVSVTVVSGKIDSIEIVDAPGEDREYLNSAVKIIPSIIDAQTPDVDTITGATLSSTGIKNAVIYALQDAV